MGRRRWPATKLNRSIWSRNRSPLGQRRQVRRPHRTSKVQSRSIEHPHSSFTLHRRQQPVFCWQTQEVCYGAGCLPRVWHERVHERPGLSIVRKSFQYELGLGSGSCSNADCHSSCKRRNPPQQEAMEPALRGISELSHTGLGATLQGVLPWWTLLVHCRRCRVHPLHHSRHHPPHMLRRRGRER